MGIKDNISGLVGGTLNVTIIIILIAIVAAAIVALYLKWKKNKRFDQFDVIVFYRDAFGNMQEQADKAGIFLDGKTGNKRFFIKGFNVGLSPDNVKYVLRNGRKRVYLFKKGLKNFSFLEIKIENEDSIKLEATEEDVNWAINEYQKAKALDNKPNWQQWLPYISLMVTGIIILIVFIWFFKQFPILQQVALSLEGAASSVAEASKNCTGNIILQ